MSGIAGGGISVGCDCARRDSDVVECGVARLALSLPSGELTDSARFLSDSDDLFLRRNDGRADGNLKPPGDDSSGGGRVSPGVAGLIEGPPTSVGLMNDLAEFGTVDADCLRSCVIS
jgi:hypothetical protein